jgi:hypothetical protein
VYHKIIFLYYARLMMDIFLKGAMVIVAAHVWMCAIFVIIVGIGMSLGGSGADDETARKFKKDLEYHALVMRVGTARAAEEMRIEAEAEARRNAQHPPELGGEWKEVAVFVGRGLVKVVHRVRRIIA